MGNFLWIFWIKGAAGIGPSLKYKTIFGSSTFPLGTQQALEVSVAHDLHKTLKQRWLFQGFMFWQQGYKTEAV